jgi:hypothetical protein
MKMVVDASSLKGLVDKNILKKIDKASRIAGETMLAESSQRIFNNAGGKDSKGKLFGTYNEQYQKQRIKNKNKNIEAINMIFTGDMQKQYIFGVDSRGNYCLGFNALPNNNSKKPNAPQKAEYLEKRFGSFFELTDQEVQQYSKIFTNEFTK